MAHLETGWTFCTLPTYSAPCIWLPFFYCCRSVVQSGLTLCDPMDCSMPGFPVLHYFIQFAQTHVHWVGDAIQPSHPLSSPSPPAFNLFQNQGLFQWVDSSHLVAKVVELSASASIFLMNIQDWFPLGWTGLILLSKGLSKFFSNNNIQKHVFLPLSLLYGPALMSVHDYWRNHSFDYMNLCSSITIYFSLFLFIAESQILFFILLIYKL